MRIDANAQTHQLIQAMNLRPANRAGTLERRQNASPVPPAETPSRLSPAAGEVGRAPLRPSSNASGPGNANPPPALALASDDADRAPVATDTLAERPVGRNASERPDRVQALLDAWGQPNSHFDLNADGTVNGIDLAHLLAMMSGQGASEPATGSITPPNGHQPETDTSFGLQSSDAISEASAVAIADVQPHAPATPSDPKVQGLLDKWGSTDESFDLNGDGVVNGIDLAMRLAEATKPPMPEADDATIAPLRQAETGLPIAEVDDDRVTTTATDERQPVIAPAATTPAADAIASTPNESSRPFNLSALAELLLTNLSLDESDQATRTTAPAPASAAGMSQARQRAAEQQAVIHETREKSSAAIAQADDRQASRSALRAALDQLRLAGHERQQLLQSLLNRSSEGTNVDEIG